MRIQTMRKALVGLIGTVMVGALLSPAPAGAKTMEFLFQGGDEPFGTPPVAISMTGKDPTKPTRVTGFAISGLSWNCNGQSGPFDIEEVPFDRQSSGIGRNKNGDPYFAVNTQIWRGSTLYTYHLWGGQHRKDPRWWLGKVRMVKSTPGEEDTITCDIAGDDGGSLFWKARLVKACPGRCKDPF